MYIWTNDYSTDGDPEAVVKKHISQLKKYNELKDIALALVAMISDNRKLKITEILEEMGIDPVDNWVGLFIVDNESFQSLEASNRSPLAIC